jgi:hypothetical protein
LLRPKDDTPTEDTSTPDPGEAARSKADKIAEKKKEEKRKADQDWLLRGYEQQLQARAVMSGQPDQTNLYTELTQNKELAKAAGLNPVTDPAKTEDVEVDDLHTGLSAEKPLLSLRPDAALKAKTAAAHPNDVAFRPFITPFGATEAAGLHNFFSSVPALSTPIAPTWNTPPPSEAEVHAYTDPDALEVPGMTAAETNPTKGEDPALALDILPGERFAEDHPSHDLALELPESNPAIRLQQQQDAELRAPGQKPRTAPPVPINPLLLKAPPDATAEMVPDTSPIRVHLDDPYDILNR